MQQQKSRFSESKKRAFSLVEIAIVMIIIGIMVVAVVQVNSATEQASIASARSLTKSSPVTSIDGLELWLETTMEESFDNIDADNGVGVTNWYDLSNNKLKAVQSTTTNRPIYTSKAINGLPALYFDGATNSIDLAINADGSNYTIFVVVRIDVAGAGLPFLAKENTADLFGISSSTTAPFTFSVNPAGSAAAIRVNGTSPGSVALSKPAVISAITDVTKQITYNLKFGRNMNSTNYLNGYIGEIIIFKKALNEIERKDIEQYLGKKWGVVIN